ncbi:DEKNAAC103325 [Brettanomyces naardenensis]|uniref:DEKNAAC103325 n=1 Tax=Brettanomyces naardenensis TaxID=13370 RepID=A0A448YNT7_BRENA|nr:DEKNAAC103325 [Brettanomyces naardenensis]
MPHVYMHGRAKSSSSLKEDGQSKRKVKQFAAGKLVRNGSYGKLARIKSNESFPTLTELAGLTGLTSLNGNSERPRIGRSKSSGDVLRSNKSALRLSSMAALSANHRTRSYPNLGGRNTSLRGTKHKMIIDLTHNDSQDEDDAEEEEVESFDDDDAEVIHEPKQRQDDRPVANHQVSHPAEDKDLQISPTAHPLLQPLHPLHDTSDTKRPSGQPYDADFLLSQSTGQERQVSREDDAQVSNSFRSRYGEDGATDPAAASLIKGSSSSSLIFQQSALNLAAIGSSVGLNKTLQFHQLTDRVSPKTSTHSMKAANTDGSADVSKPAQDDSFANNFNSYLATNQPKSDSRTQQRLWLQRENINSLVDLSDSNNPFTTNVTRLEYEKLSREYLSIRRFSSPVVKSLTKVENMPLLEIQKKRVDDSKQESNSGSSFNGDFKEYEKRVAALWKKNSREYYTDKEEDLGRAPSNASEQQRQRAQQYNRQQYPGVPFNRLPQQLQPTTRAQQKVTKSSSFNLVNLQN